MSYIKPFQSVALFESTFKHQINPRTSRVENRKFVLCAQLRAINLTGGNPV